MPTYKNDIDWLGIDPHQITDNQLTQTENTSANLVPMTMTTDSLTESSSKYTENAEPAWNVFSNQHCNNQLD